MKKFLLSLAGILFAVQANAGIRELYTSTSNPQEYCLALNIYHEARSSNLADQAAVADVVLNRVYDTRYPNTVCDVVYQARMRPSWKDETVMIPVRNQCQFSWYCDGKDDTPTDQDAWISAQQTAYFMMLDQRYRGITQGATHYHATYVDPEWNRDMNLIGRIGAHVYYRWEK